MTISTTAESERTDVPADTPVKPLLQETAHAAYQPLADRLRFELTPKNWDAFQRALDQPLTAKTKLRKLLNEPGLLD